MFKKYLKQYRQLIPLLLLTYYSITAIFSSLNGKVVIDGESYEYGLNLSNYLAFGFIIINWGTYFLNRKIYKYTFAITIILGLFNIISFDVSETIVSLSLNSLSTIRFQPQAFLAGLVAYIVNFKRVNNFLLDSIGLKKTPEELEQYEKAVFANGVLKFKENYSERSVEDLTEIINSKKHLPEAIEAAKQLINERLLVRTPTKGEKKNL